MHSRTQLKVVIRYGLLLLMCITIGISTCQAEPKTSDGNAAIRKAQGIIRQLSQEKTTLEAEKAAWLNEKYTLDVKLKSLEEAVGRLQPLQAEVERYKSGLETVRGNLEGQLNQQRQREQALIQKHNEVVSKARAIHEDNTLLVQAVQEREQWIVQCGTLNKQLQAANLEILNQYKEKGLLEQLAELEPLTGIGQVQTESVAEDYRYKLMQLKITPFEASVTAAQFGPVDDADQGSTQAVDASTDETNKVDTGESPETGQ